MEPRHPLGGVLGREEAAGAQQHPEWLGLEGRAEEFGDGTVPALSANPIELGDGVVNDHRLRERHGPIAGAAEAIEWVRCVEELAPTSHIRADTTGPSPTLGLDLDELIPAGEPREVRVEVRQADPAGVESVWIYARLLAGGPTIKVRAERSGPTAPSWRRFRPCRPGGARSRSGRRVFPVPAI